MVKGSIIALHWFVPCVCVVCLVFVVVLLCALFLKGSILLAERVILLLDDCVLLLERVVLLLKICVLL